MPFDKLSHSTDFTINELKIVTKVGNLDIRDIYEELNIFDGMFIPSRSGNILIRDAQGLAESFLFDGSEYIKINIGKTKDTMLIDKTFRIYKMSDRKNSNETSETYVLHFVSDEYIFSEQQKINQACRGTYSTIAKTIMQQYLKLNLGKSLANVDNSYGEKEFIMPGLNPFDAINYCAKRAVDLNGAPNFLVFENAYGYNFCSLSSLTKNPAIFELNFNVKNTGESLKDDFLGVIKYEVLNQFDYIKNTKSGVYAGKFIGIDPITRQKIVTETTFLEQYEEGVSLNQNIPLAVDKNKANKYNSQMTDSRIVFYTFSEAAKYSNYIKQKDPSMLNKLEDTHNFVFQRKAILDGFVNKTIRLLLPGNFLLTSGVNVNLKMPTRSFKTKETDSEDSSLNGNYTVIATRHIIKGSIHETVIDVATNSTENKFVVQSKYLGN